MRRTKLTLLAIPVVAGLSLAGCGSDGPKEKASSSTPSTSKAPTGTPIVLSSVTDAERIPEILDGARAAVSAINAAGGIKDPNGGAKHPLKLVTCDSPTLDRNAPAKCAREAIDAGAIASVGKFGGAPYLTGLAEKGIPSVGGFVISPPDFADAKSYPLAGGPLVEAAGLGASLQQKGHKRIGLLNVGSSADPAIQGAVTALLANGKDDLVVVASPPLDPTADLAPTVAKIVDANPDAVAVFCEAARTVPEVRALRQAGYEGPIALTSSSVDSKTLKDLGDEGDGLLVISNYPAVTDPAAKQFNKDMETYAKSVVRSPIALNAWLSVRVVADALAKATALDSAALIESLNTTTVDSLGIPSFDLGKGGVKFLPFPRVPRATVQIQTVTKGKLKSTGPMFDLNTFFKG